MGGSSSKSSSAHATRLTHINNTITESVSKNTQVSTALTKAENEMLLGKVRLSGCSGSISQSIDMEGGIKQDLTEENLTNINDQIEIELKKNIKSDTEAESGALKLPYGGADSESNIDVRVDNYIENNKLLKNVSEKIASANSEMSGKNVLKSDDIVFDPCGLTTFRDLLKSYDGLSPTELGKAISEMTSACKDEDTGKLPKCEISQDIVISNIVDAGIKQVIENIAATTSKTKLTDDVISKTTAKSKGLLQTFGEMFNNPGFLIFLGLILLAGFAFIWFKSGGAAKMGGAAKQM